jgi:hypothetical protein
LELGNVRRECLAAALGQSISSERTPVHETLLLVHIAGINELAHVSAEIAVANVECAN